MMNIRHEGALKIKTEIKVDAEEFLVPTLSLQMLVENALKHKTARSYTLNVFTNTCR